MNGRLHTLLRRQIQRHLGSQVVPADLNMFITAIDAAYRAADGDRAHLERALDLSSQELMQSNAELRAVLQAFPDVLLWIDAADKVVRVHGGSTALPVCSWLGHRIGEVPEAAVAGPLAKAMLEVRATGRMDAVDLAVGPCCFEARLLPLMEGQVLAILRDISVRKQAEETLMRAMETAQMTARLKSEFLATMSHEIRTPLNAVLGMTSLLECTRLDTEQKDLVSTVRVAGETLLALVNDVLDLSKLEAGKLVVEEIEFDLRDCIDSTVQMVSGPARAKGLEVVCQVAPELPAFVRGDPTRLRQVLINLIGNAVKFTERGSVAINASQSASAGDALGLRFQVRDTGIGIAKQAAALLFQPFTQADGSTSRQFGGTGLGLAICKRLVEGMGGSIGFESTPGVGTTFWFTVACRMANVPVAKVLVPAAEPTTVPQTRASHRVLLVEDNAVNQQVARRMLERLGHSVEVAGSGDAALDRLGERAFDIVLMDCQMPGLDGFQTTRELRQREAMLGRRTPVIAFTANVVQEDLDRCRAAGMDDCLTKPVRLELLRQMLDRWLPATV